MKYLSAEQYYTNDPNTNQLVLVNIDLLLDRLWSDSPEYFIGADTKNISSINRVKEAIKFIKANKFRLSYFEPALLTSEFNKIGVIDGRHRIIAAKKNGVHSFIY